VTQEGTAAHTADALRPPPLIAGGHTPASVTATVCALAEQPRPPRAWLIAFAISATFTGILGLMVAYLFWTGVGVWGLRVPVAWGWDITNFVFWVGIGHAGTLISAILFLCRQRWRTSINRFAEAMTIFAIMCAGIFPAIHIGRPWLAYWLAPYPNQMSVWPQFRSPLLWDVFAVSTYFTVSLLFWYIGMIPDLASLRDRAQTRTRQMLYGLFALGWRGSNRHWHVYERAYLLLAGLATPLVLSVHSVVSFDFAVSNVPGWHSTIFPPYFVAGAIFSGMAMVLTLLLPARQFFGLKDFITPRHLENMAKLILATGMMVTFAYVIEAFHAYYSGDPFEGFVFMYRARGDYAWAYWIMVTCNVLVPQLFWFKKCRTNLWVLFAVSILVNVGMWFERFVIIVSSLSADFLPSSWAYYSPTWVEVLTFTGSFGLFFTCFLLFCRYLPMLAMAELKPLLKTDGATVPPPTVNETPPQEREPGNGKAVAGLMAEFASAPALLKAAVAVRDAGYTKWDAHTPHPVHGLDHAMGVKPTPLPWIVFIAGATGAAVGLGLQWFTNALDYPLLVSGKPFFSLPANIPVVFELTILFASIGAVLGMLGLNRLPELYHALFTRPRFRRASDDRFFIWIEAADQKYDAAGAAALLRAHGAATVETVED
jgi:molybdopterin-containing oxidoreductase family membrane subunit